MTFTHLVQPTPATQAPKIGTRIQQPWPKRNLKIPNSWGECGVIRKRQDLKFAGEQTYVYVKILDSALYTVTWRKRVGM